MVVMLAIAVKIARMFHLAMKFPCLLTTQVECVNCSTVSSLFVSQIVLSVDGSFSLLRVVAESKIPVHEGNRDEENQIYRIESNQIYSLLWKIAKSEKKYPNYPFGSPMTLS